jgi:hypothetical protein
MPRGQTTNHPCHHAAIMQPSCSHHCRQQHPHLIIWHLPKWTSTGATKPTPHCRQRHPHQIIWHPPNWTSTGATIVYLAFHHRRRHAVSNRYKWPNLHVGASIQSSKQTTHLKTQRVPDKPSYADIVTSRGRISRPPRCYREVSAWLRGGM